MTSSEGTPGHPADPRLPVQPGSYGPVPRDWLREYDRSEASKRLDRLAADQDLIITLALQNYEGPDYNIFETELSKYGIDVIIGWLRRGVIFAKCRERGFGGLPPPAGGFVRGDDVEELAYETVAKALYHFREDVLLKNRWVSSGGTTLKTFFVGQCVRGSRTCTGRGTGPRCGVSRLWTRTRAYDLSDQPEVGPEDRVVERSEILRGLRLVKDERVRAALILTAEGLPHWQIAKRMDVTEKTVERMVANHRTRMRKLGIA